MSLSSGWYCCSEFEKKTIQQYEITKNAAGFKLYHGAAGFKHWCSAIKIICCSTYCTGASLLA